MTVGSLIATGLGAALIICVAFFIVGVQRKRISWRACFSSYVRHLAAGAGFAVTLTIVVVLTVTIFAGSPQGPLSLVILGPIALILGAWSGALIWLLK
jgi:hypothetical protein